ncbi:putative RNA recognition motif domain, nucleotide-binding alpha-beta plait domain superfamily [Helianthus annuus]|nr:putative RNA recognition motif domain, nucleotide-binding alpha-beta plait domain superfamily [Helianthus annuus]
MDPEEWEQARNRKGKRTDRQAQGNNKVLSKFFVSNLPPKCSSQDLKEVLGCFGRYEGSYIARKVDKWGKRFSFVSFSEVRDVKRLEEELSDVWIGSYKLFITLARFVDGERVSRLDSAQRTKPATKNVNTHANPNAEGLDGNGTFSGTVGNGRSFVDSLLNRNKVDVIRVDDNVERFSHWYGNALMGRVVDFQTLISLKQLVRKQGWKSLDIKYLGGLTIVLVLYDSGDRDGFFIDKVKWSVWFEHLEVWAGSACVEEGRVAWLQVHGVPAQLVLDDVFELIGSRFGKVVRPASLSGDHNNLSYALIGVLSKEFKRIVDRVDISWRGKIYKVWVDEDVGEWIPQCVAEDEEDNSSVLPEEVHCDGRMQDDEDIIVQREEGEYVRDEGERGVEDGAERHDNTHDVSSGVDGVSHEVLGVDEVEDNIGDQSVHRYYFGCC